MPSPLELLLDPVSLTVMALYAAGRDFWKRFDTAFVN